VNLTVPKFAFLKNKVLKSGEANPEETVVAVTSAPAKISGLAV